MIVRVFVEVTIPVNEGSRNLSKVEISCNVGMIENINESTRCHRKFRNEIDVVVSITSIGCRWLLSNSEFAIELGQVEGC
jgi:hypothetical protein